MTARDYTDVTELPGLSISRLQLDREVHRYQVAARYSAGGVVLDAACGSGIGLGVLARSARAVVGGDYTPRHLDLARQHVGAAVPLLELDAQALPFRNASFDAVLLLEAIYYLPDPVRFLREAHRVLRAHGKLVISSANPAWPDFSPSPHSVRYFDSLRLQELVREGGFEVQVFGAFAESHGVGARVRSLIRRAAIRFALIPGSLAAKAVLKRFFYGSLVVQPATLAGLESSEALRSISAGARETSSSIIYAIGTRNDH